MRVRAAVAVAMLPASGSQRMVLCSVYVSLQIVSDQESECTMRVLLLGGGLE